MENGKVSNLPFSPWSITASLINRSYKGSVEIVVPINDGMLDPVKHSAMHFKENSDPKIKNLSEGSGLGELGEGYLGLKGRGSGYKGVFV